MPQVLINTQGLANLPAIAPAGWPANITWPGGQSPNTAITMTISDAAWLAMITWIAGGARNALLGGTNPPAAPGPAPTSQQILAAWLNILVLGSINATQQYQTVPAVPPPPISIAGV